MTPAMIQVCVTTYERSASLRRLLHDLEREDALRVSIYDDGSTCDDYASSIAMVEARGWTWQRERHHGRECHLQLRDKIWKKLEKEPPAELYVFLEDDLRLCFGFFDRLVETWQGIDRGDKAALMLFTDERDAIWGARHGPEPLRGVDRIDWVDTSSALDPGVLRDLAFTVPVPPAVRAGRRKSSGVGRGLTHALRAMERTMYRARPSLVAHVSLPSRMHSDERTQHPLHAKEFIDGSLRHDQLLCGEL